MAGRGGFAGTLPSSQAVRQALAWVSGLPDMSLAREDGGAAFARHPVTRQLHLLRWRLLGRGLSPPRQLFWRLLSGGGATFQARPFSFPGLKWEGGCAKEREEGGAVSARLFFCGKIVSPCAAGAKGKQTENARALRTGKMPQAG